MTTLHKAKGPVINAGLCRCCSSVKKCRLMTAEYEWMGHKEVYFDMILDCFGLLLANVDNQNDGVCATCVVRIRDACNFRKQMLGCEEAFLKKLHDGGEQDVRGVEMKTVVKDELPDIASGNKPPPNDRIHQPHAQKTQTPTSEETSTRNGKLMSADLKDAEGNMSNSLFRKMKMTEMRLHRALRKPAVPSTKKTVNTSKDFMSAQNLITLVETSYVCPFRNRKNSLYCYYCYKIFARPDDLREHTLTHDPKELQNTIRHKELTRIDIFRIDCRLCSERIDNLEDFKTHLESVHKKKFYSKVPDHYVQFRLTFKDHTCVVCNETFSNFYFLYNHTIEHFSTFTCNVCGKGFLHESILNTHLKLHKKGSHVCETCGKVFKDKRYKESHVNAVHKRKCLVHCPKCDDRFLSFASKNRHLIEHHGEPQNDYPCHMCDKTYPVRKSLMEHIRHNHLNGKKYECKHCEQKFHAPSKLKEHMTVHTGERSFECEFCNKTYPRLATLQSHRRIHTNDRRHKCNACGQAFIQRVSLRTHIKSRHPELDMKS